MKTRLSWCRPLAFLAVTFALSALLTSLADAQAIKGLQRIVSPEEDILIDLISASSVRAGVTVDEHVWPIYDTGDDQAAALPDTAAWLVGYGRSENHMAHTALAMPPEAATSTLPNGTMVTDPVHQVQLNSEGLDQGFAEVFFKPTGDVAAIWSSSESIVSVLSQFNAVVNPSAKYCRPGITLTLNTTFDIRLTGVPAGALHDAALLRKEIGNSYVQAVYDRTLNGWQVQASLQNGSMPPDTINEFRPGQELVITEFGVEIVACGQVLNVEEITDYCCGIGANDGVGPAADLMQFTQINHGSGSLFAQ